MAKYRIHFLCDVDRDQVKKHWALFLKLAATHGILPPLVYRLGRSKRDALKKPVDLTQAENIDRLLDKFLNKKNWPDFVSEGLWADQPSSSLGYHVSFSAGKRFGQYAFFSIFGYPDDLNTDFEAFLKELRAESTVPVIVFQFVGTSSDIRAVSDQNGEWVDRLRKPRQYRKIELRTGFAKK